MLNIFEKELSWKEIEQLEKSKLMAFSLQLDEDISVDESFVDIVKMANLIQLSRGRSGFCAMTEFTCNFCGKTEVWGNANPPGICKNCALDMAKDIAIYCKSMLKDEQLLSI